MGALLLAPLAALALGACNEVEPGRYGQVDFTPDGCGRAGCDLDDGLAMGATTQISLDATDGGDASDLDLISADPYVFDVIRQTGGGPWPTFTVLGNHPGRADLIAIDRFGDEVDYIRLDVVRIENIEIDVYGDKVSRDTIIAADGQVVDRYRVAAESFIRIHASAEANLSELMGLFEYGVVLGPAVSQALTSSSSPSHGHFEMFAPRGEHDLQLVAPGGAWKRIHLTVQ